MSTTLEGVQLSTRSSSLSGGEARRLKDQLIAAAFAAAAVVSIVVLLGIFWTLLSNAAAAFSAAPGAALSDAERAMLSAQELKEWEANSRVPSVGADFLGALSWNPSASAGPLYGVLSMVSSTLLVTALSMSVATPIGLAAAAWLAFVAPRGVREIVKPVLEILAAIPSVVVGFLGIVVVGPAISQAFGVSSGLTALNGGVLLAIMALPTIISIAEDALIAVPRDLIQASLALGADRWQTLVKVVLPAARSGVMAALMLGMGRAIGETMTVLMATGNALATPHSPLDSVRTLTATIAIELGEVPQGSQHYHMLFAVGLVLFCLTFAVNLVADHFIRRSRA